ncbi:hypothetical protein [Aurantimonas sp. HBX-1]|uniref:hypothetical protein n=1 Tax=Aurantimonas sp. HBX-1 TaxID=2906072 RepID=UPI001F487263|nr:hypothetical protein [Aurantimonas sp. HBX-1]UIJ72024.1 hypothetical protein LXB15_20510 [Aurantimonas sp. HBX-1]
MWRMDGSCEEQKSPPFRPVMGRFSGDGMGMRISGTFRRAIVWRHSCCYVRTMFRIAKPRARPHLPTSEGFAKLSDRARLPGRFFYRLVVAGGH